MFIKELLYCQNVYIRYTTCSANCSVWAKVCCRVDCIVYHVTTVHSTIRRTRFQRIVCVPTRIKSREKGCNNPNSDYCIYHLSDTRGTRQEKRTEQNLIVNCCYTLHRVVSHRVVSHRRDPFWKERFHPKTIPS